MAIFIKYPAGGVHVKLASVPIIFTSVLFSNSICCTDSYEINV